MAKMNQMPPEVPVYLFTGFLESGKTTFIQETLEDTRFNNGDMTLLLLCEEGEEVPSRTSPRKCRCPPTVSPSVFHASAKN